MIEKGDELRSVQLKDYEEGRSQTTGFGNEPFQ